MPVKLVCGCGNEIVYNPSALQGIDWIQEPMIGGTRILCPKCKTTNKEYLIDKEIERLIEVHVNQAREEATEKYTPEYVKQLRKDREKMLLPLFKNESFIGGCSNKKA